MDIGRGDVDGEKMALKISRREWDRGRPREGSLGRCCRKHSHSASERLLGYVVLMLHSLSNFASRCIPKHALTSTLYNLPVRTHGRPLNPLIDSLTGHQAPKTGTCISRALLLFMENGSREGWLCRMEHPLLLSCLNLLHIVLSPIEHLDDNWP